MWLWRQFLPPPTAFNKLNDMLPKHYEAYNILVKDSQNGTKNGVQWYKDYIEEIKR